MGFPRCKRLASVPSVFSQRATSFPDPDHPSLRRNFQSVFIILFFRLAGILSRSHVSHHLFAPALLFFSTSPRNGNRFGFRPLNGTRALCSVISTIHTVKQEFLYHRSLRIKLTFRLQKTVQSQLIDAFQL